MRKITLIFTFLILNIGFTYGQVTAVVNAPPNDASTTQNRAPNGTSTHSFMRGSALVLTSELTSIPVSSSLNLFGFVTTAGANVAVTGTLTVYMKNSTDTSFTLGTNWSTIITGMTQVYSGTYTVPASATNIDLTLSTPLVYTGGSIYVAYDFVRTGTAATTAATYGSNSTGLVGGCVSAASASAAPTTLASTSFRPVMRFGYPNPYSNDVSIESINSLGNVANVLGTPVPISALVMNKSNTTLNNVTVNANLTGANAYTDAKIIATIEPGATQTVNFNDWTPTTLGANTLNVSVPTDQVNTNNSLSFNNTVSCNTFGISQNPVSYTGAVGFGTGSGILSTPFQVSTATTITGVNAAISNNTASVGRNVYGVILSSTGTILATSTNTLTIANGDLNSIKTFNFSPSVSVAANQLVYYGLAQTANATAYYPLGTYTNAYLTTSYYTTALTGGAQTLVPSNLGQMGIELNLTGTCALGVESLESIDNNLTVFPNPASSILSVKLNSFNNNTSFEVYNTIGQLIIPTKKIDNNKFEINVASLTKGVYFLKVNDNNKLSSVKFVVER
ncbi:MULTISPECIES: T9SS type A sorting domain-containing protein [Flavobacterium]|uniref:Secretion system C-terminal sorting domain-containing protein n=1 Tax=Flavobacterium hankyongi TaxID=1176532 RepID=A0ABP9A9J6_9FLAO|nr:T9SS type A sorting domain-containing protein [Flavobacterium sp. N1846]